MPRTPVRLIDVLVYTFLLASCDGPRAAERTASDVDGRLSAGAGHTCAVTTTPSPLVN